LGSPCSDTVALVSAQPPLLFNLASLHLFALSPEKIPQTVEEEEQHPALPVNQKEVLCLCRIVSALYRFLSA
jgi:hypothetical protein